MGATEPVGTESVQRAVVPVRRPVLKRPKNRKAQIALVAAELFCERGYHGVGVDEIAAAVGISGPAVYRHFPNKYAVLVDATRDLADAVRGVMDHVLGGDAASTAAVSRLDRALAGLARLSIERRKVAGLYQWEGRYLTPEHRAELHDELSELVGRLAEVVSELRPDLPRFTARLLVRAALSVLSSPATHRAPVSRSRGEPLLQSAARMLLTVAFPAVPARESGFARESSAAVPEPRPPRQPRAREASVPPAVIGSRREILLAEAISLFRRNGYHAVGIEEIGRAAGINASSVYRHFPSKADLLAAVYHRAAERVAEVTALALAGAVDPEDALRRLVDGYVELSFHQGDLVAVYQAENNNLPQSDRHELRRLARLQVEEWVQLLVGIRPELTAAEARVLVHAALNLIADLGTSAQAAPTPGLERPVAELALAVLRQS